jgi:hypothetical protein
VTTPAGENAAAEAWALAASISPRPAIRIAAVDDAGRIENRYPRTISVHGTPPPVGLPYALHLTDARHRFRLLGFDLDAKTGPVAADLAVLRELLGRADLEHIVCASGPGGGRHVWVALAEPVPAELIGGIAHGLAALLPSIDTAALLNPATGALRPPGAPHRAGGVSTLIAGDLATLRNPRATAAQVRAFADLLEPPAAKREKTTLPIARDANGNPHLIGSRRDLAARASAALTNPLPKDADTSAVLAAVLCGAARGRWRFADIAEHLATAPGLEHARTARTGHRRVRRTRANQLRTLRRQWARAVTYVATTAGDPTADDPTWNPRCQAVIHAVTATQRRADASPGRWTQGGGPADRRVLDVLCDQTLAAVQPAIEFDIRRLANLTGLGRDTARVALQRLSRDGWITRTALAAGVHAAHWALTTTSTSLSTPDRTSDRSQAAPRPPGLLRAAWRSHLARRTAAVAHDVFTPGGLGHRVGQLYQALGPAPSSVLSLAEVTGYDLARVMRYVDGLVSHGLAKHHSAGFIATGSERRDQAAVALGVAGALATRHIRYDVEREAWAWWLEELQWRAQRSGSKQRQRFPGAGQLTLTDGGAGTGRIPRLQRYHGTHPTKEGGRADYAAALRRLRAIRDTAA